MRGREESKAGKEADRGKPQKTLGNGEREKRSTRAGHQPLLLTDSPLD